MKRARLACYAAFLMGMGCTMGKEPDNHYYADAIVVDFPVKGVWIAPTSPGSKIPSHGTTDFAVTYAIDMVKINERTLARKAYRSSFFSLLARGLPLGDFYGWGEPVFSPVSGTAIQVVDTVK